MSCFSLAWIEQLLIWAVIVIAIVAILRLLIPFILAQLGGGGGIIMSVINILMWAIICIFVIYFCFAIISCLMTMGGGMPLMPHH
jgi:hypothetical protein